VHNRIHTPLRARRLAVAFSNASTVVSALNFMSTICLIGIVSVSVAVQHTAMIRTHDGTPTVRENNHRGDRVNIHTHTHMPTHT